jgi:hypothetical protein
MDQWGQDQWDQQDQWGQSKLILPFLPFSL